MPPKPPVSIDDRLRSEFRHRIEPVLRRWVNQVQQAAGSLHLPVEQRHDTPGWLSPLSMAQVAAAGVPVDPRALTFEVPPDCAWWHEPELDRHGRVLRFFAHRAWVDVVAARGQSDLVFLAGFAIEPQALWELQVLADGVPLKVLERAPRADGFAAFRCRRRGKAPGPVRLEFLSPVARVVRDVHPGSTDTRLLSLAVSHPLWLTAGTEIPF